MEDASGGDALRHREGVQHAIVLDLQGLTVGHAGRTRDREALKSWLHRCQVGFDA